MGEHPLSFLLPGFHLSQVEVHEQHIEILAERCLRQASCPACQVASERVHSYYARHPRDLPLGGHMVRLCLNVRRFRCLNAACPQATFAERVPELVAVGARRTQRLTETLRALAFAQGGEAGARYGAKSGLLVSPDTLLRLIRQTPVPDISTPRVLGVDDFALRKGRRYGTVLIDGETHRPVDLLEDRTAFTLAEWLQSHPGVEIITRDRATEYARGATGGAPEAIQVADRWHLLSNLREAVTRLLNRLRSELVALPRLPERAAQATPPLSIYDRDIRRGTKDQVRQQQERAARYARYAQVRTLHHQGRNILQIARETGMTRQTVRTYIASETFPERPTHPRQPSILDPYVAYLQQRWDEGCHHNAQLYQEICARGFRGSIRALNQWTMLRRPLLGIRQPPGRAARAVVIFVPPEGAPPTEKKVAHTSLPAASQLAWVVVRPPASLTEEEQHLLLRLHQSSSLVQAYELAQRFMAMVRERRPAALAPWIQACLASQLEELVTFATGLQREEPLIRAALEQPFSNGVVEGHVTRIKQIRRAMYGRGNFDLLRRRVLIAA
ncbi:MAG: ISL3 family transposase [Ardenticatenales bacterium]|nr:ISL3 family transposase [Ardenticatenales bacterium]